MDHTILPLTQGFSSLSADHSDHGEKVQALTGPALQLSLGLRALLVRLALVGAVLAGIALVGLALESPSAHVARWRALSLWWISVFTSRISFQRDIGTPEEVRVK